jgi:ELWxxDGT repeat protein
MPRIAPPRRRREFAITRPILTLLLITASSLALAGSPHLVLDINSQYTALDSSPVWLGKLGSSYYFIAHPVPTTAAGGDALFKTDGTAAGTSLVAPIDGLGVLTNQAGPLFIPAGTKAYFLAFTTAACKLPTLTCIGDPLCPYYGKVRGTRKCSVNQFLREYLQVPCEHVSAETCAKAEPG